MTRPRTRPARPRSLGPAVLIGVGHAVVAAAATGGCYLWLASSRRFGPGSPGTLLLQATGITALLWAYVGLLLGLVVGILPPRRGGAPRRMAWRPAVVGWHRQLDVVVIALALLHALVFALAVPAGTLLVALVPWTAHAQGLGYTLGVLSLYLAVLLGPSYYLRRYISRRVWLVGHQLAALSYALGLWHALFLGSDLRLEGAARTVTAALQIPLLVLIGLRLRRPLRRPDQLSMTRRAGRFEEPRHVALRVAVAVGLSVTAMIVLIMALYAIAKGQHGSIS